jgi:hypothetical protein
MSSCKVAKGVFKKVMLDGRYHLLSDHWSDSLEPVAGCHFKKAWRHCFNIYSIVIYLVANKGGLWNGLFGNFF